MPMGIGMTFPEPDMCGRLTMRRRWGRLSILMALGAGFSIRGLDMSGFPATTGGTRLINADCGISTTILAGDGLLGRAAIRGGGLAAADGVTTSAEVRLVI